MKSFSEQVIHRKTVNRPKRVFRPRTRCHMKTETVVALLTLFLLIPLAAPVLAQYTPADWPGTGSNGSVPWVAMRDANGAIVQDGNTESGLGSAGHYNLTFNASPNDGSAYVAYDQITATCFFRFHVDGDPMNGTVIQNGFWIVSLGDSTATSTSNPIGAIVLNGNGRETRVVRGHGNQAVSDTVYTYKQGSTWFNAYNVTSVSGTTTTYFLDFQMPMAALTSYIGITASSDLRFYFGTSQANGTTGSINKDWMLGNASAVDFSAVSNGEMTSVSTGILPVELSNFTAHLRDGVAHLMWETTTELNNYGFEVHRSVRSEEWDVIGFVPGHGTSFTPQEYRYDDPIPLDCSETVWYRLRQIDRDGSIEYSPVVKVRPTHPADFGITDVFPNPFNPTSTLSFTLTENVSVSLHIHDIVGRRVMTVMEDVMPGRGSHARMLKAGNLPSGRYFAVLHAGSRTSVYPIVLSR